MKWKNTGLQANACAGSMKRINTGLMQGSSQGFWELGQKALSIHRGVPLFLQLLQPGHTAYTEKVKTVLPPL